MLRNVTFKRIAIILLGGLAIAAGNASSALADGASITSDPDPNVISCSWGSNEITCKFGNTLVVCSKFGSGDWYCGSSSCGCSGAEEPKRDELELRAMVTEVEEYVNRVAASAPPRR